jgi:protein TonB
MHGRVPDEAPPPPDARGRSAAGSAPPSRVTALPEVVDARVPPSEYPAQARREGKEGVVKLRLVVGVDGRVAEATIVQDPGSGLGAAALRVAQRYFRFRPARIGDEPVATEIPFDVRFELP